MPVGEIRTSDYIDYKTWNGTKWRAYRYQKDQFTHAPDGNMDKAHHDTILNYLTTDGTHWTASWAGNAFHHTPEGGGLGHVDPNMNYIGWADPPHVEVWQVHWDSAKAKFVHERVE